MTMDKYGMDKGSSAADSVFAGKTKGNDNNGMEINQKQGLTGQEKG